MIRSHIGEVEECYDAELATNPLLAGQIQVQFTISESGPVVSSVLQRSTVANPRLERCTVNAVRSWVFPRVCDAGIVIISYPFLLTPAEPYEIDSGSRVPNTEIEPVDTHLFLFRTKNRASLPATGLIVVLDKGLLMVDATWSQEQAENLIDWAEKYFNKTFVAAILSHDHPDSVGGVAALLRRRIPTLALDLTVARLAARGITGLKTWFSAQTGSVKDPRGFEGFFPGAGHTPDNIVIAFPNRGVLFGECLAFPGFLDDMPPDTWQVAAERIARRYPKLRALPDASQAPVGQTKP